MVNYTFTNTNLVETTTPIQSRRGNRSFIDTSNNVRYISYSNGTVRRELRFKTNAYTLRMRSQHVLNLRKPFIVPVMDENDRLAMIDRLSSGYRYNGSYRAKLVK